MADRKVVLVTGAGQGIGRAVSEVLARAGHRVYASMRSIAGKNRARAEERRRFAADERADRRTLESDVLSEGSCRAAATG